MEYRRDRYRIEKGESLTFMEDPASFDNKGLCYQ